MVGNATKSALIACVFLCPGNAFAQSADKDPAAVVELGIAAGRSLKDGGSSFGPALAIEITPMEN